MASKRSRGRKESTTVGYAVVGLGHIAQTAVLPAFDNARNARLAALVSDDVAKREKLSRKYGVPAYSYDTRVKEILGYHRNRLTTQAKAVAVGG